MTKQVTFNCPHNTSPVICKPILSTRRQQLTCCMGGCGAPERSEGRAQLNKAKAQSKIKCSVTETTAWDEYALRLNTTRAMAIFFLNRFDRSIELATSNYLSKSATPYTAPRYYQSSNKLNNADLAEKAMKSLQAFDKGITLVNAHCSKCASTFEFKITGPDNVNSPTMRTAHKPLTYCPYCATPTLVVTPTNQQSYTERSDQAWQRLATMYLPDVDPLIAIAEIRAKYNYWEQYSTLTTFDEFMQNLPNILEQNFLKAHQPKPKYTGKYTQTQTQPQTQQPTKHKKLHLTLKKK